MHHSEWFSALTPIGVMNIGSDGFVTPRWTTSSFPPFNHSTAPPPPPTPQPSSLPISPPSHPLPSLQPTLLPSIPPPPHTSLHISRRPRGIPQVLRDPDPRCRPSAPVRPSVRSPTHFTVPGFPNDWPLQRGKRALKQTNYFRDSSGTK